VIFSAGLLALLLALFQAFTPPWDYDGLAYHLQGPRLFLEAGRIIPIPENWFTYYPSTWEMLYLLGMGLGSDIFARLIHFSTLILLLLATYAFGKRFLPKPGGWLAAAILLGIPILPLWGNAAYTDIAWALFQFLAIGLFLIWVKERNPWLLGLSGVTQGLALGSKYLALSSAGILLVFVILFSARNENKWAGWKQPLRDAVIFGLSAFLVALPWYLKNFLWTGNPIFPLYFPQNLINPAELKIWTDYINSFGTGKNWFDYLLLPVNIYLQHDKFGTFMGSMEMPNPLFLFVLAYPFIRRKIEETIRRSLDILAAMTGILFIAWSLGSQQIRFLLPLFPGLSIISSQVLMQLLIKLNKYNLGRTIKIGLVGGMVISSLIFMGLYFILIRPEKGLLGLETKSTFIQRMVRDNSGINYANEHLAKGAKMMLLWDGRGYYCDRICLPDVDQSRWTAMVERSTDIQSMSNLLQEEKITHLFLSNEDASFFLLKHDPEQIYLKAAKFLLEEFVPACTKKVYDNEWSAVYELLPSCK
jgi:4-amino-4-deoxy-L-arabinose transferase-like glycosyltransferase